MAAAAPTATTTDSQQQKRKPFIGNFSHLGEKLLDVVLEGEVEGLGGEVTDAVGDVSAPEGTEALLRVHAGEAVADAGVAGDLPGDNLGVGILGLYHKRIRQKLEEERYLPSNIIKPQVSGAVEGQLTD